MKIGISTACLYPTETSESLRALLQNGHRHFEIFFNTFREIEPQYLRNIRNELDKVQATVCSVHPFTSGFEGVMLFSGYQTRFEDSLVFYDRYFEAARFLGARYVILHGAFRMPDNGKQAGRYADRFCRLNERAAGYGVEVLQENVVNFLADEPDFIRFLREETQDRCGFCFDIKQAVRAHVNWEEMIAAMGSRLRHIHISDHSAARDCMLPGEGCVDYRELFEKLDQSGYEGDLIIEVYKSDFQDMRQLWDSERFLKSFQTR